MSSAFEYQLKHFLFKKENYSESDLITDFCSYGIYFKVSGILELYITVESVDAQNEIVFQAAVKGKQKFTNLITQDKPTIAQCESSISKLIDKFKLETELQLNSKLITEKLFYLCDRKKLTNELFDNIDQPNEFENMFRLFDE